MAYGEKHPHMTPYFNTLVFGQVKAQHIIMHISQSTEILGKSSLSISSKLYHKCCKNHQIRFLSDFAARRNVANVNVCLFSPVSSSVFVLQTLSVLSYFSCNTCLLLTLFFYIKATAFFFEHCSYCFIVFVCSKY